MSAAMQTEEISGTLGEQNGKSSDDIPKTNKEKNHYWIIRLLLEWQQFIQDKFGSEIRLPTYLAQEPLSNFVC